jgi:hypothetical protein
MGPHPKEPEPMQVDEVNYNHHTVNNSIVLLREGTPEYRMAPLDGIVEHTSGRSGKKRRRYSFSVYSSVNHIVILCYIFHFID